MDEVQRHQKGMLYPALRDLQILYIGKSINELDSAPAIKGIQRHETLQKVLHDNTTYFPDQEVSLILCSFKQYNSVKLNSAIELSAQADNLNKIKLEYLLQSPTTFSEMQRISFIEAGLINLFKPKYNDHYKYNFPSESHLIYNTFYHADLDNVIITLDFSDLQFLLYTGACKRNNIFCKQVGF